MVRAYKPSYTVSTRSIVCGVLYAVFVAIVDFLAVDSLLHVPDGEFTSDTLSDIFDKIDETKCWKYDDKYDYITSIKSTSSFYGALLIPFVFSSVIGALWWYNLIFTQNNMTIHRKNVYNVKRDLFKHEYKRKKIGNNDGYPIMDSNYQTEYNDAYDNVYDQYFGRNGKDYDIVEYDDYYGDEDWDKEMNGDDDGLDDVIDKLNDARLNLWPLVLAYGGICGLEIIFQTYHSDIESFDIDYDYVIELKLCILINFIFTIVITPVPMAIKHGLVQGLNYCLECPHLCPKNNPTKAEKEKQKMIAKTQNNEQEIKDEETKEDDNKNIEKYNQFNKFNSRNKSKNMNDNEKDKRQKNINLQQDVQRQNTKSRLSEGKFIIGDYNNNNNGIDDNKGGIKKGYEIEMQVLHLANGNETTNNEKYKMGNVNSDIVKIDEDNVNKQLAMAHNKMMIDAGIIGSSLSKQEKEAPDDVFAHGDDDEDDDDDDDDERDNDIDPEISSSDNGSVDDYEHYEDQTAYDIYDRIKQRRDKNRSFLNMFCNRFHKFERGVAKMLLFLVCYSSYMLGFYGFFNFWGSFDHEHFGNNILIIGINSGNKYGIFYENNVYEYQCQEILNQTVSQSINFQLINISKSDDEQDEMIDTNVYCQYLNRTWTTFCQVTSYDILLNETFNIGNVTLDIGRCDSVSNMTLCFDSVSAFVQ